ncbi:hypothetical protein T492DRAFT_1141000 [Pavlovales sp. CCMP2436]|nr:hypothetical protein T492DRAFT_1141000 [Pavlovales sp. CCMP2436]
MRGLLLCAAVGAACAFQRAPRTIVSRAAPSSHSSRFVASRSPRVVASLATREPAMMDGGIYKFNKVVIDSVYDLICLLYPVTGGPRDFARFYVLETVASSDLGPAHDPDLLALAVDR